MVRPVPANVGISLGYRERMESRPKYIHRGIDFAAPYGTPVVATRAGTVVYVGQGGGNGPACGLHIIIKCGEIYVCYYHLSREQVSVGQVIAMGQLIGHSGASGNVTGPHLHYQEQTGPPGYYTTDRRPQFIDNTVGHTVAPTLFDLSHWSQAHEKWFHRSWASRANGIAAEIRGNEPGSEASVHTFTEVYSDSQAATLQGALGATFTRVPGRAGLELFYDNTKWEEAQASRSYSSGIQGRYALVVHLRRKSNGKVVAFIVVHGPVQSDSLKAGYGRWLANLIRQVEGPKVVVGDFNRSKNSQSPRRDVEALGYRDMRTQANVTNESAHEFPSEAWDLADIYTLPSAARVTGGLIDLTSPTLSDHRRIETRIEVPA